MHKIDSLSIYRGLQKNQFLTLQQEINGIHSQILQVDSIPTSLLKKKSMLYIKIIFVLYKHEKIP